MKKNLHLTILLQIIRMFAEGVIAARILKTQPNHTEPQKREIHYHQFLRAGENTLNFKLAAELFPLVRVTGGYSPAAWLATF